MSSAPSVLLARRGERGREITIDRQVFADMCLVWLLLNRELLADMSPFGYPGKEG